ncbi:MAG: efflux RND transporter permease subunit [Gemmobacter sp.]
MTAAKPLPLSLRRPVLTAVVHLLIIIAGLAALTALEVRELPRVERGIVSVTTAWDGAPAELIDREVTARIEGAAARVPGLVALSASSRPGRSRVVAELAEGVDPDKAAAELREAIARVAPRLPDGVEAPRVTKADDDARHAILLALTSDSRAATELTRMVAERIEGRLVGLPGVADVGIQGQRDTVIRIEADLTRLGVLGLGPEDLRRALGAAQIDLAAGAFEGGRQAIPLAMGAEPMTVEALAALPVAPGVLLGDLAVVLEAPGPGAGVLRVNGEAGVGVRILREPGANILALSAAVAEAVAELAADLPPDTRLSVVADEADFVRGAVREVVLALAMATGIVLAVIFAFLRQPRLAAIPAVSLPVALSGTIAVLWMLGYSINVLTLMALVVAAGLVVDDAIVVVENIARLRAQGVAPARAAAEGTAQVAFAAVATTAVLIAVVLPLIFLPGQIGGLFREFAVALAVATAISTFVALTLVPMLAAQLLTASLAASDAPGRLARGRDRAISALLAAPLPVLAAAAVLALAGWDRLGSLPQELTPVEDRGEFEVRLNAPTGAALDLTDARMLAVEAALAPLTASGEVAALFVEAGAGGRSDQGKVTLRLALWDARRPQAEIVAEAQQRIAALVALDAEVRQPTALRIRGAGQGLQLAILGPDYTRLADSAEGLAADLAASALLRNARSGFAAGQPELALILDRDRLAARGVDPVAAGALLRAAASGLTLGSLAAGDRAFDLVLTGRQRATDPQALADLFVPGAAGAPVALAEFIRAEERASAAELGREAQRRAVTLRATPAEGVTLAAALAEARRLAPAHLGPDMRLIPLGEAAQQGEADRSFALAIGVAALLAFLALAAQFESPRAALAVMASVPPALAAGLFALGWSGVSLNLYSQIGLLLLVGLTAKTAVLIVEFAETAARAGAAPREAIAKACALRLRPIAMTLAATVLGALPLMLATGPGAEGRAALGTAIAAGLALATAAILIVVPASWLVLAGRRGPGPIGAGRQFDVEGLRRGAGA